MKYVIMADGKETRWKDKKIHKWQVVVDNERIIDRTVRLLNAAAPGSEILVTSHWSDLALCGARRYEPLNNVLEIDRFTWELISDDTVFLYGDSFYTEEAIKCICENGGRGISFFGNERRIFAVKVADEAFFRSCVTNVRERFLAGELEHCIGWDVFRAAGAENDGEMCRFIEINDETRDFNTLEDYREFILSRQDTDERAVAFFDSGVGGLTCVSAFRKLMPEESINFYGDSLRAPYGVRSDEEIYRFTCQIADFLDSRQMKLMVIACNTISAVCLPALREKYTEIPVLGMIDLTAKYVAEHFKDSSVGVIATPATVRSDNYRKFMKEFGKSENVYSKACPSFVPIIEDGICTGEKAEAVVHNELDEFIAENKIEALILGCTHYPFLTETISKLYPALTLVNPADVVAEKIISLFADGTVKHRAESTAEQHYYSSKKSEFFEKNVREISCGQASVELVILGEETQH